MLSDATLKIISVQQTIPIQSGKGRGYWKRKGNLEREGILEREGDTGKGILAQTHTDSLTAGREHLLLIQGTRMLSGRKRTGQC